MRGSRLADAGSSAGGSSREGERAVSEILGAVLLFGILIAMMLAFQVTAIPIFNLGVESDHNQRAQVQLDHLRTNMLLTAASGDGYSTHVELGTDYPNRLVFLNPAPATGRLRTDEPAAVRVRNAVATGEVGDYWTGETQTFQTRPLVYTPHYNEYGNAPVTHLENGLIFNQYDDTQVALSSENLVDGRRISLLTVNGSLSAFGTVSRSIDIEPASAPARTVAVRNETEPVVVTVPTRLVEAEWRDLLADELVSQGGHISSLTYTAGSPYNRLRIELEPGITYELSLSMVGVGSRIDRPGAHYVTTVERADRHLPPGRSTGLTVEVRDPLDNPVSGVTVSAAVATGGGTLEAVESVTGTDGQATFRYTAPGNTTTATVRARIDSLPEPREVAEFTVDVFDTGQSQDFLDMGQNSKVVFVAVTSPTGNNNNKAEIDFRNRDTVDKDLVAARFVSYYDSAPSSPPPEGLVLAGTNTTLAEGGEMTSLVTPIGLPSGSTRQIVFDFHDAVGDPSGAISKADFVMVSFRYSDGTESMYLIQLSTK